MAGKREWSFAELESMDTNTDSLANDYLSGDEDDIERVLEQNIDDNIMLHERSDTTSIRDVLLDDIEMDSDDEPLARRAERWRNSSTTFPSVAWSKQNCHQEPPAFEANSGVNLDDHIELPIDVFLCLFPEELIDSVVFHTNLYATQKQTNDGGKPFQPTNREEIKLFLGVNILMGVKKLTSLKDYWSSQEEIRDSYISKVISRDRFYWLLSHLHFSDNALQPKKGDQNFNKLYKLGSLLTTLSRTYKEFYSPTEFQAIDESMIKYKGRSSMKQYMPAKPTKRGYKVWVRADDSGFVCEFQIYTGKVGDLPEKDLGGRVVRDLTKDLKNKNYKVFFDNYFTSVPLAWDLKQDHIYCCGTLKKGKKYLPNDFIDDKRLTRGQYDWRMTEDMIVCLKWKNKKPVYFLSNYHNPEEATSINRRNKDGSLQEVDCPRLVVDYNKHMGSVDLADMLKKCYAIDRKSKKWYHRIVWHFVDTTIVNAYILFQKRTSGSSLDLKKFRINVASGLIGARYAQRRKGRKSFEVVNTFKKIVPIEKRIDKAAHMPIYSSSRRCANCSTKKEAHRSMWSCTVCEVALCLNDKRNCFLAYHSS
nr:unnamed protein product [Callosobruchus chinensis]